MVLLHYEIFLGITFPPCRPAYQNALFVFQVSINHVEGRAFNKVLMHDADKKYLWVPDPHPRHPAHLLEPNDEAHDEAHEPNDVPH